MGLSVVTAATVDPVSRAEAVLYARIVAGEENDVVDRLISAATTYCEMYTRRSFISTTWRLKLDEFPCGDAITLPRSPLSSISSLTYYDAAGDLQTWSNSNYIAVTDEEPGALRLAYNVSWPSFTPKPQGIAVTFVAGYGSSGTSVPKTIKQAIHLLVNHWFENREAVGTAGGEVAKSLDALLWSERVGALVP